MDTSSGHYEDVPSLFESLEAELRELGYELPVLMPEEGARAIAQTSPEINEMLNQGNPWPEVKDREVAHARMAAGSYNDRYLASLRIDIERQLFHLSTQPGGDRSHSIRLLRMYEDMIEKRMKEKPLARPPEV